MPFIILLQKQIAGVIADIPLKFCLAVAFSVIIYILSGLKQEPGKIFLYFLVTFLTSLVMSAVFRTSAAVTKTVSQAMGMAGVMILALVVTLVRYIYRNIQENYTGRGMDSVRSPSPKHALVV